MFRRSNIWFLYVLNRERLFCGTPDTTTQKEAIEIYAIYSDSLLFMLNFALFFQKNLFTYTLCGYYYNERVL